MLSNIKATIIVTVLVFLGLRHDVVAAGEGKRLGSPVAADNHNDANDDNRNGNNRELQFNFLFDAVNLVGNGIGNAVNTVGNGVTGTVNTVGNGVANAVNTVGNGVTNAAAGIGNAANNAVNGVTNTINGAIGDLGLGGRCGIGGACNAGLQCSGGALTGICLPVRCISENVIKHATYFDRLLNTGNGGGVEFAKNYTVNHPQERDAISNDFSRCFGDGGTSARRRERNLAASSKPITGIGALGEVGAVATGTFYYLYVFPEGTIDNRAANIIGFCAGAGIGAGLSLKPMYDIIFADTANDAAGTWTYARFEVAFPVPPVTLGFGVHVGVNAGSILGAIGSIGSSPIFDLRITLILPGIGGVGANFASVAGCQAVNAG